MAAITYWVIRYVPNVVRGEFQNIGIVCGSDDADWVAGFDWAYLDRRTVPRDVREWAVWFAREVNSTDRVLEEHEFTRAWVEGIRQRQANAIQLSPPLPVNAENAKAAADLLYPLLVHRERPDRPNAHSRRSMRAEVRSIYRTANLREGVDFVTTPSIKLGQMAADFDFIQLNDPVPVLRNVWAFNRATLEDLRRDIQAWNYGITRLRGGDGQLIRGGSSRHLPSDSVITAIVDEPSSAGSERQDVFATALEAWQHERVDVLTLSQLESSLNRWAEPDPI